MAAEQCGRPDARHRRRLARRSLSLTSPSESALARHPHLGEDLSPGRWRVDCHVHSMWSGDSTTTPDELAEAVSETGLDVVCITDHSTLKGALRLAGEFPCRVVVGQEQRTPEGELIGLFLEEPIPSGARSAREAAAAIRRQGGVVYVPHPFDPLRHRLRDGVLEELAAEGLVDVVEALNGKTSLDSLNEKARRRTDELGLLAGAGSDAHVAEALGAAVAEMAPFDGPEGFLDSLEGARLVGHFFDPPRAWRPRVVPSLREGGR